MPGKSTEKGVKLYRSQTTVPNIQTWAIVLCPVVGNKPLKHLLKTLKVNNSSLRIISAGDDVYAGNEIPTWS